MHTVDTCWTSSSRIELARTPSPPISMTVSSLNRSFTGMKGVLRRELECQNLRGNGSEDRIRPGQPQQVVPRCTEGTAPGERPPGQAGQGHQRIGVRRGGRSEKKLIDLRKVVRNRTLRRTSACSGFHRDSPTDSWSCPKPLTSNTSALSTTLQVTIVESVERPGRRNRMADHGWNRTRSGKG